MNTNAPDSTTLKGSAKEMVQQFLDLIKERQLTIEEVEKILPLGKDFYTYLSSIVTKQIEEDSKCHNVVMAALGNALAEAVKGLTSKEISFEEKQLLSPIIFGLQESMKEIELSRQEKSYHLKKWAMYIGGAVIVGVGIMLGNKTKICMS